MHVFLLILAWILALLGSAPLLLFAFETLLGARPLRTVAAAPRPDLRLAVLLPAHNEQALIARTLAGVQAQLRPDDTLLVVADNCTDQTASHARAAGATVVERHDPICRGKGYALDCGVRHLAGGPAGTPDVVVLLDADCTLAPGALDALAAAAASGRPAQAVYLMTPPPQPSAASRVSALAFCFKNLVRPLGLHRVGVPCHLTGTGMAFPWPVLAAAPLASGNIVEDMQLGLDLARAGAPPTLCPAARVTGELPADARAAATQRRRWEHGHLATLLHNAPRLALAALRQRRLGLLVLALDLAIPPLSLLVLLTLIVLLALAGLALLVHAWLPLALLVASGCCAALCLGAAWWTHGRACLPPGAILSIPFYVARKIPLYLSFWRRREQQWVRTARPGETATTAAERAGARV